MRRVKSPLGLFGLLFVTVSLLADCGGGTEKENRRRQTQHNMAFSLTSPAFTHGGPIPRVHTCEGDDTSPPLTWGGAPPGTQTFALIVDDPDAPDPRAPKRTYVHWVVYNMPASATALPAGASSGGLPAGSAEVPNDFGRPRYGGPCPPVGRHRYFHKLYALDATLGRLETPNKAGLLQAMEGHILAQAELMGTYEMQKAEGGRRKAER